MHASYAAAHVVPAGVLVDQSWWAPRKDGIGFIMGSVKHFIQDEILGARRLGKRYRTALEDATGYRNFDRWAA